MDLPRIGLGTMGIEDASVIETALELGYRHVDTAQIYANERVIGEGIAQSDVPRSALTVATKVWADALAYDAVIESTHESLERLGLDRVDLLYVHRPIETYDPEETLAAFEELHQRGVIDHVGLSNFSLEELEQAQSILDVPIGAHQVEFHPLFWDQQLLEHARANSYPLVAYSPLSGGRAGEIEAIQTVAEQYDETPERISLAWVIAHEGVCAIPKASSPEHLEANRTVGDVADELATDHDARALIDGIDRVEELYPE